MSTQTREKPIIFSSEMVRAILEGRKTQTRRVMKIQPHPSYTLATILLDGTAIFDEIHGYGVHRFSCPYGAPGDRLWVRETWALQQVMDAQLADDQLTPGDIDYQGFHIGYFADGSGIYPEANIGKKRSPIFMPRWASRINLDVLKTRVERVQDISEEDAIAESITAIDPFEDAEIIDNRGAFAGVWNAINGMRGYGWNVNPWVWVIEFPRFSV